MDASKYQKPFRMLKKDRKWPDRVIEKAPVWCSVDLRDGNQALEAPMTLNQKLELFQALVDIGFKEIEVGFPMASDTEFNFIRELIDKNLIPDDVTIQVLTQSRKNIIERTFEAVRGAKNAIIHLYNSTSVLQRKVVFKQSKEEIKKLAVEGAILLKQMADEDNSGTNYIFEYSPESFTQTEPEYALEVCNAVLDIWQPTPEKKAILNLPNTVELTTANVYADQIEYISDNIKYRDGVSISIHTHNDRGCAVAATELALMAGADRVEGTLFGNGERTGNADIVNIGLNLLISGIDPMLDLSDMDKLTKAFEDSTHMVLSKRHPYAGSLVYTAFSGSHQDAIRKGFEAMKDKNSEWAVPYLTIDPADVGRTYEAIIRINSQSGKGGVAYILEQNYGLFMPKQMHPHFSEIINKISDRRQGEISPEEIFKVFEDEYINIDSPIGLVKYSEISDGENVTLNVEFQKDGSDFMARGEGNGLLSALTSALLETFDLTFEIANYNEHSMEYGSKSRAITYIQIIDEGGKEHFGVGISSNISKSSIKALISAVNKMIPSKRSWVIH